MYGVIILPKAVWKQLRKPASSLFLLILETREFNVTGGRDGRGGSRDTKTPGATFPFPWN